jgi:hypothetical protein
MKNYVPVLAMAFMIIMPAFATGIQMGDAPNATLTVSLGSLSSPYTWFDNVLVTATVTLSGSPALGCDVIATCTLNPAESSVLRDDGVAPDALANNGVYTGYYRIGGANGSAMVAKTGNRITVTATRPGDSGTAQTAQFTTFAAKRWTGVTTTGLGTEPDNHDLYTNFVVTRNGSGWHHSIVDFGVTSTSNKNGAMIRVPVFPRDNALTNLTVIGGTEAQVIDNVIQFKANLVNGATSRFTIGFDCPSDLAATYIDKYNTAHIGLREFRNGYIVWNAHVSQAIFGSPNLATSHGVGVTAGMQVLEKHTGLMRSIDCMERVGIVYDGTLYNSGGSYPYNIKWQDQADNSWLVSSDLNQMTFRIRALGTYCAGNLAIEKTVQFYSDERYIRQNYTIENVDTAPHSATMVWGREQWMYGDTTMLDDNDRGFIGTGTTLYGSGFRVPGSEMTENFFGAVDVGTHYSISMIFGSEKYLPTYMYFLLTPPLRPDGGSYPIDYSGVAMDEGSTFFETQFGSIPAGGKAYSEFFMWGGYGTSVADVQSMIAADAQEIDSEYIHDISIRNGWNLISIPLETNDKTVTGLLSGIDGRWDKARYYDCADASDPWKTCRPGGQANDLAALDRHMGVWLHATEECTLRVTGSVPSSTQITLRAGWNLVGYPSQANRTLAVALAGTGYERVEVFQPESPYIMAAESTYVMTPGEGYWIKVPADAVWNINW